MQDGEARLLDVCRFKLNCEGLRGVVVVRQVDFAVLKDVTLWRYCIRRYGWGVGYMNAVGNFPSSSGGNLNIPYWISL
jgi:hypothetical protein